MSSEGIIIGIVVGVVLLCLIFALVVVAIYYMSANNADISKTVSGNNIYILPNSEFDQESLLDDAVDLGFSGEEDDEVVLLPEDAYLLADDQENQMDVNLTENLSYDNSGDDAFIFDEEII